MKISILYNANYTYHTNTLHTVNIYKYNTNTTMSQQPKNIKLDARLQRRLKRAEIREKILNKLVNVKCGDFDKYGRLLTEIFIEDECVNQWLIDNEYAFEYDGGTKKDWEEFLNKKNSLEKIVEEETNETELDKSV